MELLESPTFDKLSDRIDRALPAAARRDKFVHNGTVHVFGDSLSVEPGNAHTADGESAAGEYARTIGATPTIDAVSGRTSVDGQNAIVAYRPTVNSHPIHAFGTNESQFLGITGVADRMADLAEIWLAEFLLMGVPEGTRKIRADAGAGAGVAMTAGWANHPNVANAKRSTTNGDAIQFTVPGARHIALLYVKENGSGGTFRLRLGYDPNDIGVIADTAGVPFRTAPLGALLTNTGRTYAVGALLFDLGRYVPSVAVQLLVTSATGAGNGVGVLGCVGLDGLPLAGPLLGVTDMAERGVGTNVQGWETADHSEISTPRLDRLKAMVAAKFYSIGGRLLDFPWSRMANLGSHLSSDLMHFSTAGKDALAAAMAALYAEQPSFDASRPDAVKLAELLPARGHFLMPGKPVRLSAEGLLEYYDSAAGYTAANVTLGSGWTAVSGYNAPAVIKQGNIVTFQCPLQGSGTATSASFTVPVGYRPLAKHFFPAYVNGAMGGVTVDTNGAGTIAVGAFTGIASIDGVSWLAA